MRTLAELRSMPGPQSERREQMRGVTERRTYPIRDFEWRAGPDGTGGSTLRFSGYACVTETPYDMFDMWGDSYSEVVSQGAFARTLGNSPDVPFVIQHAEIPITLARTKSGTLTLAEDGTGLLTEASLDGNSPLVQILASAIERRDMDEMSFAFITRKQQWSPDYTERRLNELDIHRGDVSVVIFGANDATAEAGGGAHLGRAAAGAGEKRMPTEPYTEDPDDTQVCPQCQSGNEADAKFCDQCGTPLTENEPAADAEAEAQQNSAPLDLYVARRTLLSLR